MNEGGILWFSDLQTELQSSDGSNLTYTLRILGAPGSQLAELRWVHLFLVPVLSWGALRTPEQ